MSKHFFALIFSFLFASLTYSQTSTVLIRDGDDFRGSIRSIKSETVVVSRQNGEYIESQRVLTHIRNYSSDGRECETITYAPDGSQQKREVQVYNEMGKLVEWNSYDADGLLVRRKLNSFDEGGRITQETTLNGDGTVQQRKVLIWSSTKDKILEIDTYDGEGLQIRKDVSRYDNRNKKLIWLTEEPSQKRSKQTFDLNSSEPRLQEYVGYNANGSAASTHVSSNTAPVQQIEKTNYNEDGSVQIKLTEHREFDSHQNRIKVSHLKLNKDSGVLEPLYITYNTISYY
ncbi:MAG: hypothetical protein H0U54_02005 [Acidobacteria bacterium]|nr:hypothetical protein [Acidobacteriota bacterium]